MKILFLTTQTLEGSTVVGRVLPLAEELAKKHEVHVLVHRSVLDSPVKPANDNIKIREFGHDPFTHTKHGKKRLRGFRLIWQMKRNAWAAFLQLRRIRPDVLVIVKPLPENVLAAWMYGRRKTKIILDVDDFELAANKLTSIWQRAAIHWSERTGAKLADTIITASPFLQDHFTQLAPDKKVVVIPTGIILPPPPSAGWREAPPRAGGEKSILYLGSVSIASGHRVDMLPEILLLVRREIPDTHLAIAGSGDDTENLKRLFAKNGLSDAVTWHGRFSLKEVPRLIQNADVLIDPIDGSITNRSKSSFRVMVACQAGKPIVTSTIGIRAELVPPVFHDRFFATPENSTSYSKKIIDLLQQPLSQEEAAVLVSHTMRYTWKMLTPQYEKLLLV